MDACTLTEKHKNFHLHSKKTTSDRYDRSLSHIPRASLPPPKIEPAPFLDCHTRVFFFFQKTTSQVACVPACHVVGGKNWGHVCQDCKLHSLASSSDCSQYVFSVFSYYKQSKTGWWEGLVMRLAVPAV